MNIFDFNIQDLQVKKNLFFEIDKLSSSEKQKLQQHISCYMY